MVLDTGPWRSHLRSYLHVPGHRSDHVAKAHASAADAVVLELEDGVAPARKDAARPTIAEVLDDGPSKPTFVRINPIGSAEVEADVSVIADRPVAGLRVPKVESVGDILWLCGRLDGLGSSARLHLLLESALAVERAPELLRAHPRVAGAALGEQDLAADVGVRSDEGMLYARSRLVLASAAARLGAPVQSVWTDLADDEGLQASCEQGRALGFVGRSAIHPSQLSTINAAYTSDPDEVAAAEALARRFEASVSDGEGGMRTPDGRFVDRAVMRAARRTSSGERDPS